MAVYTTVPTQDLVAFLTRYEVGDLVSFEGILSGVVNTNYFVTTTRGEFVLTLFEALTAEELPWYLEVMSFLVEHGVPGAAPVRDQDGSFLGTLQGLPATLVQRLHGRSVRDPNVAQLEAVADALGQLHVVGQRFPTPFPNPLGVTWAQETAAKVLPLLPPEQADFLREEVREVLTLDRSALPVGLVHTDLFRDNVLLADDEVAGLIDFYYACTDSLLYDVAITLNDWCRAPDHSLDRERSQRFLAQYQTRRRPTSAELEAWPQIMRAAGLRFWLSRLRDVLFPIPGELTHTHDPDEFLKLLRYLKAEGPRLRDLWDPS